MNTFVKISPNEQTLTKILLDTFFRSLFRRIEKSELEIISVNRAAKTINIKRLIYIYIYIYLRKTE